MYCAVSYYRLIIGCDVETMVKHEISNYYTLILQLLLMIMLKEIMTLLYVVGTLRWEKRLSKKTTYMEFFEYGYNRIEGLNLHTGTKNTNKICDIIKKWTIKCNYSGQKKTGCVLLHHLP